MKKLLAALILMMSVTSWASDFEDGLAAFNAGDYSRAEPLLRGSYN